MQFKRFHSKHLKDFRNNKMLQNENPIFDQSRCIRLCLLLFLNICYERTNKMEIFITKIYTLPKASFQTPFSRSVVIFSNEIWIMKLKIDQINEN